MGQELIHEKENKREQEPITNFKQPQVGKEKNKQSLFLILIQTRDVNRLVLRFLTRLDMSHLRLTSAFIYLQSESKKLHPYPWPNYDFQWETNNSFYANQALFCALISRAFWMEKCMVDIRSRWNNNLLVV